MKTILVPFLLDYLIILFIYTCPQFNIALAVARRGLLMLSNIEKFPKVEGFSVIYTLFMLPLLGGLHWFML